MAHYESPEDLPEDPVDLQDGDTVDMGAGTFVLHRSDHIDIGMLRHLLESVIESLQDALGVFDNVKEDSEKINVMANVLSTMHEWSHTNLGPIQEWMLGAMEQEVLAEAEKATRNE